MISRYIYTLVLHLLLPSILVRLWLRGRHAPAYRQRWTERLGLTPALATTTAPLWIHAVSVGEVQAVATLIRRFLQQHPQIPVLVTTMTPTGADRVKQLFGDQVAHRYCPYDLPWAMSRFLNITQPRACVIVETELWPNFLKQCQGKHIPTLLANARLSERSARGYARFSSLTRDMLNRLSRVAVQDQADAERFKVLGLDPSRLKVIGSIKFDVQINPQWAENAQQLKQLWGPARPVFLAASTHDDEEAQLLAELADLMAAHPDILMVLAPRHPERFNAVAQLCQSSGLSFTRHSQPSLVSLPTTQIYLADTRVELMTFCIAADIVFVGGSLIERGGHNPLEPALLGKPVITGVHTFNFATITQGLASSGALSQVTNAKAVMTQVQHWLNNPETSTLAGQAAQHYVASHAGALGRLEAELESLLQDTTTQ